MGPRGLWIVLRLCCSSSLRDRTPGRSGTSATKTLVQRIPFVSACEPRDLFDTPPRDTVLKIKSQGLR